MNAVEHIVEAFENSIGQQKAQNRVLEQEWDPLATNYHFNLQKQPRQMSRYISKTYTDSETLSFHSKELPGLKATCSKAAQTAILLFCCTIGAGVFMTYETPTVGLGCTSGSYLLYAIMATSSCLLLIYIRLIYQTHMPPMSKSGIETVFGPSLVIVASLLPGSMHHG